MSDLQELSSRPIPFLQLLDLSEMISLPRCRKMFYKIPVDPYVKQGFRYKKIARFTICEEKVLRQPHKPLWQPKYIIPEHQGMARIYHEFDPNEEFASEIHPVIKLFAEITNMKEGDTVLFQTQRVKTSKEKIGLPTSEGWHQDGTQSMMALLCVNRKNIQGGRSQVALAQGENIIFDYPLSSGEMVIFDDHKFWHYVTPIYPADETKEGYRDVFIIANLSLME